MACCRVTSGHGHSSKEDLHPQLSVCCRGSSSLSGSSQQRQLPAVAAAAPDPAALPRRCQVYPSFLRLAAQSSDPVDRLQWVVTYIVAGLHRAFLHFEKASAEGMVGG